MLASFEVESYLQAKGQWRQRGAEWVGICPACNSGEKTLSVNVETGQWCCNRKNNCGASGGFKALQEQYGDRQEHRPTLLEFPRRDYVAPKVNAKALKQDGRNFLNARGLTDLIIEKWRVGQQTQWFKKLNAEGEGLAWPVYSPDGKLANVKTRALLTKDFANQKGCAQWPVGIHTVDTNIHGKVVTFCEGELDAMSLSQFGRGNVCSLPNGAGDQTWIDLAWDWLGGFREIYLCLDADKAGQDALAKVIRRLGYQWIVRVVTMPDGHKDANDCLMAGVTREAIAAAFDGAKEVAPDTVHSADYYTERVKAKLRERDKMTGFASGFRGIDRITHGFRAGELSIWTGQSGSGKSTVLGMIAVNTLTAGIKTCISSLEIPPDGYLSWLTMQATGEALPTDTQIEHAMKWLGTGFYMVDRVTSSSLDDLLSDWAYCAQRHGCRQFIVDPLQCIDAGADEYAGQAKIINALIRFARQYDCHVHLVAHPKKLESDKADLGQNSIKGNKAITDLAHNIFAVVRGEFSTTVHLLKVREYDVPPGSHATVQIDKHSKQVGEASAPAIDLWPWINTANNDPDDIPEWQDEPA